MTITRKVELLEAVSRSIQNEVFEFSCYAMAIYLFYEREENLSIEQVDAMVKRNPFHDYDLDGLVSETEEVGAWYYNAVAKEIESLGGNTFDGDSFSSLVVHKSNSIKLALEMRIQFLANLISEYKETLKIKKLCLD